MKQFLSMVTIFIALFQWVSFASGEEVIVRVANWPPNYFQDKGTWTGLDVEIARAIVEQAGITPIFKSLAWARALKEIKVGRLHLLANLSKTDERSEFMRWIGPVRYDTMSLIVKEGNQSFDIQSLDDMIKISKNHNKRFGYHHEVYYSKELNDRLANDSEMKSVFEKISKGNLNIKKTLKGRILGFFESTFEMNYKIKNNPEYNGLTVHPFTIWDPDSAGIFIGVSKKVPIATYTQIKNAFRKCVADGIIKKLNTKWGATNLSQKDRELILKDNSEYTVE